MAKALTVLREIEKQTKKLKRPLIEQASRKDDPYRTLILCILSLRTKDTITKDVGRRLFKLAPMPKDILRLKPSKLKKIIRPVGFYRNKTAVILEITKRVLKEYSGKVPDTLDELIKLKGVGRKSANLVLGTCYNVPAICVDTHVHRISNRLGWVNTKQPRHTEEDLKRVFNKRYWIRLNPVLVSFGQNICTPLSPYCSKCPVNDFCPKIGVKKRR